MFFAESFIGAFLKVMRSFDFFNTNIVTSKSVLACYQYILYLLNRLCNICIY